MIIFDFSGIVVPNIFALEPDEELNQGVLRHITLNSLRMHYTKFKNEYGKNVFIACDSSSWRKDVYPEYKAARSTKRDESKIDWSQVYSWLDEIKQEINEYTPFTLINTPKAEADDVIATLVERYSNENILIVSADKDFLQLQQNPNVKQYSVYTRKMMKEEDPHRYLLEHILRGDSSDGVPNVLSDDDTFITEGKRQSPLRKKRLDELCESWINTGTPYFDNEIHLRNFYRNQRMIDLSFIPIELKEQINYEIDEKLEAKKPNVNRMMNYLISKRCQKLLGQLSDFF
jgi:hypothetical protein